MKIRIIVYSTLTWLVSLTMSAADNSNPSPDFEKIERSNEEWKQIFIMEPERYRILREEGTEPSGSSELNREHRKGIFVCAACELPLFKSETKYDSGTGWPSFWDVIPGHIETKRDFKLIWPRTEYHCARCGSHQGHLFEDGPKDKTGLRYCNNGLALRFIPDAMIEK